MYRGFWYESKGGGSLHGCRWEPENAPRAVVQIVHGIKEYARRYDEIARYLTERGYLVVAEDHMGHGESISDEIQKGWFNGGWFTAVDDTYELTKCTMAEFPGVPYILLGHSMGSFLVRTILARYPDSGIQGAILSGTAWMKSAMVTLGRKSAELVCACKGARTPSKLLSDLAFGSYNRRVEHQRTPNDWLSRDRQKVDAYTADPLCNFIPTAGLMRDMMIGVEYIHNPKNLTGMDKTLPVFFIAGADDPVGDYGVGVEKAAEVFHSLGMERGALRLWPLCRHEIFNEINRQEIFEAVYNWIESTI